MPSTSEKFLCIREWAGQATKGMGTALGEPRAHLSPRPFPLPHPSPQTASTLLTSAHTGHPAQGLWLNSSYPYMPKQPCTPHTHPHSMHTPTMHTHEYTHNVHTTHTHMPCIASHCTLHIPTHTNTHTHHIHHTHA